MFKNFNIFASTSGDNSSDSDDSNSSSSNSTATPTATMDAEQFKQILDLQKSMLDKIVNIQGAANPTGFVAPGVVVNTALLPNFENFDTKNETFRTYKQRFENYLEMKNLKENKEYSVKLLLNSIGAKHFTTITALAAPKAPSELTYDELIKLLETHLSPKKNLLVCQHQFLSKYQTDQQSIAEYVASLRSDINDCEFISTCDCKSSIADIFLRAQFIRGIKDCSIREKLLQSEKSTFEEIVSKAIALEASKIDSKEIAQKSSTITSTNVPDINKISSNMKDSNERPRSRQGFNYNQQNYQQTNQRGKINFRELGLEGMCLRCGQKNHLVKNCQIDKSELKCCKCDAIGHVGKVCLRTLLQKKSTSTESTNLIQETEEDYCRDYGINTIYDVFTNNQVKSKTNDHFYADVKIEGQPVRFEVDSGSGFTFLPRNMFFKLGINTPILPTSIGFRSYTQDVLVPDGKVKVNIEYKGRMIQDEIFIVHDDYSALLGRSWIRRLKINFTEVDKSINSNYASRTSNSTKIYTKEKLSTNSYQIHKTVSRHQPTPSNKTQANTFNSPLRQKVPAKITHQLSVGERVQVKYFVSNNQIQWKLGTLFKKLRHLRCLVKLDNGYIFKCHFNQLRSDNLNQSTVKNHSKQPEDDIVQHCSNMCQFKNTNKKFNEKLSTARQLKNNQTKSQESAYYEHYIIR